MNKRYALSLMAWLLGIAVVAQEASDPSSASGEEEAPGRTDTGWSPDVPARDHYRDILDYNIFEADRARLAREAERQRNPPPAPREAPPPPPRDPDGDLVLVGVTLRGEERRVFIEDRQDGGRVSSVTVPGDFSAGRIVDVDAGGAVYVVDGNERRIDVGQTLQGEVVEAAPPSERQAQRAAAAAQPRPQPRTEEPGRGDRRGFSREDWQRFRDRRNRSENNEDE